MATLSTLSNVPGLKHWLSSKNSAKINIFYPYTSSSYSATMKSWRYWIWINELTPAPTTSLNGTKSAWINNQHPWAWNSYVTYASPATNQYVTSGNPAWWPVETSNSYMGYAAVRFSNKQHIAVHSFEGDNEKFYQYILHFIVTKRNGINTKTIGSNISTGWKDEENHQHLAGPWTVKPGSRPTGVGGEYSGFAIAADTNANNNVLMSKYASTWTPHADTYKAVSNVPFPTTPSILCQYIFRGQVHGIRRNGENIAHQNLPSSESSVPNPSALDARRAFTLGAQISQYHTSAYSKGEWQYYNLPVGLVNHSEQDVYESVYFAQDTPYTTQDVLDIEEFLSEKWSITVVRDTLPITDLTPTPTPSVTPTKTPVPSPSVTPTKTPVPTPQPTQTPAPPTPPTPPSVFDVFKKGNEDGFTRFKRLRLLGNV